MPHEISWLGNRFRLVFEGIVVERGLEYLGYLGHFRSEGILESHERVFGLLDSRERILDGLHRLERVRRLFGSR